MTPDTTALDACPGCRAQPGENHDPDCGHAACPGCGEQLLMNACAEDERPAVWHGIDQRAEVAHARNWWTTAAGIDHLVEDYTRVLFAIALGMVTWNPDTQRYIVGEIDEERLDRALAAG